MKPKRLIVKSENVIYKKDNIFALYKYHRNEIRETASSLEIHPQQTQYVIETRTEVPKTGLMLVGMGGNNGSTVVAGVMANKMGLSWETKEGVKKANYFGSVTQAATFKMGDLNKAEVFLPFKNVLPLLDPNDLVITGWDICKDNMKQAMIKSKVLHQNLQTQLNAQMEKIKPQPSIYYKDFIALNQSSRANNLIPGDKPSLKHLQQIQKDIRYFKSQNKLDKVIVLWTANTERCCTITPAVHDTEENFLNAVQNGHPEIAPSHIFAMAAVLENCAYINGSPQNTLVPAIIEAADKRQVFIAGDDFKSGQTKLKSVLVDYMVSAGLKPESIVSYNHLGNNDGYNLSAPKQFESKRISKSSVVDDIVASNKTLYSPGEKPDHCVVIKYVPFVGDSKRAMDEYISSIFLGGLNTLVLHNTCEDSLLAAPIILDLVILTEFFQRIRFSKVNCNSSKRVKLDEGIKSNGKIGEKRGMREEVIGELLGEEFREEMIELEPMQSVLSALSYLMKSPKVPGGTPVINALTRQRMCIENIFRACLGLQPESHTLLEHKLRKKM